ncbi:hypothetical protein ACVWW5_006916 [Bradyrhizobium sp. LM3.4]
MAWVVVMHWPVARCTRHDQAFRSLAKVCELRYTGPLGNSCNLKTSPVDFARQCMWSSLEGCISLARALPCFN